MFEQLRQRLTGEFGKKKEPVTLETVQPEAVRHLHIGWNSQFNTAGLRQYVLDNPGLVLRVHGTGDYVIGGHWRRREEIGEILELQTRYHKAALLQGILAEYKRRGYRAVVISPNELDEQLDFYQSQGFSELERVIYYEKPDVLVNYIYRGASLQFRSLQVEPTILPDLIAVDHAAFPWLWWNSAAELEYYRLQEGVTIYVAYLGERPVGYFGCTLYEKWGHLDRLAIIPEMQGKGVGAYLLATSIRQLASGGAKRVTLSTQNTNWQSQRLYEGFGFEKVKSLEYSLTGIRLEEDPI